MKKSLKPLLSIVCILTLSNFAIADINVTNKIYSLYSQSYSDNGYISGLSTGSTKSYTPLYDFGSHSFTFKNKNYIGPGYAGYQYVTIRAKNIIFDPNSLIKMGNGTLVGSSSNLQLDGNVSMGAGSMIEGQRGAIQINGSVSGSGNIQMDSSYTLTIQKASNISLSNLAMYGGTLNASNNITISNKATINSSGAIFKANSLKIGTLDLYENVTFNALGIGSGGITVGTLTNTRSILASNRTATLDTHANVNLTNINLNNFTSGRALKVDTHGYGDITLGNGNNEVLMVTGLTGGAVAGGSGLAGSVATFILNGRNVTINGDATLGYFNKLQVSGVGDFNANKININNIKTKGADSILDFSGIKGKTHIKNLEMTTASVYGQNFTIDSLLEHKGNSTSVFYSNIGSSSIGSLSLDAGGSNADHTVLEFQGGGTSLNIGTATINSWGVLDASKITNLTVNTLNSSYATIKAQNLVVNNANFSNNKTYLYANNLTSNGTITLNNGAELWMKSGSSFSANTLNMANKSILYAASNNGGMNGNTTIQHIIFDGSKIYANSLNTHDIQVKNNSDVYLNGGKYTNDGDLNIEGGSYLAIHNGDFINNGELNIALGKDPSKNQTNLIDVLDGSFVFNMSKVSTGKTDMYKDGIGIPELFKIGTSASNPTNPYYASFVNKDGASLAQTLVATKLQNKEIKDDGNGHYYIEISDPTTKESINYYLQYSDANGNKIADDNGKFSKNLVTGYTTLKGDIQVPKAQVNVTIDPSGIKANQTYNIVKTKNGIQFSDNGTIYNSSSSNYNQFKQDLNQRVFFTTFDGTSLAISYNISSDNKNLGFVYSTGKQYVNAYPFIKPGTWVLGIGSGKAAFGSMGGVPGASGLAGDYTLNLTASEYINPLTGTKSSTIYYINGVNNNGFYGNHDGFYYNNYANNNAKFTINATGSDFALGKDQDIGGTGGKIYIGEYNSRSTMVINADNIYLGGNIILGDGALISGHLALNTTNGKGVIKTDSTDKSSVINIRNHSSLSASGASFEYAGTINLAGNKTVTDEVGLDLSNIAGTINIGVINATAARPNSIDNNAGIKMSNFTIDTLNVTNGNGGLTNNFYSEFTSNIGTSTINNLVLVKGTSGLDQSGLIFSGGGDSLTIDNANLQAWSFLDARKITDVYINKELDIPYNTEIKAGIYDIGGKNGGAQFNNLTLNPGSVMNTGGNSIIGVWGDFTSDNATININASSGLKPVQIEGNATFKFNDNNNDPDGNPIPIIKVSDIKGMKANQDYILFSTNKGTIDYIYNTSTGKTYDSKDPSQTDFVYEEAGSRIQVLNNGIDQNLAPIVNDHQIGFRYEVSTSKNPYDPNDIRYWLFRRGGETWVNDISSQGDNVIGWLNELMINKHNPDWAREQVYGNDLKYFQKIGEVIQSTLGQVSSVIRKNNSTSAIRLATDVAKTNRLVKVSNPRASSPSFAEVIREMAKEHYASNGSFDSMYQATARKISNRNDFRNNVWITALGAASFVTGGNSKMYGVSAGYDRFVSNILLIGGYLSYARGYYTGDIINNDSYNGNFGLYSRAYFGPSELDLSVSETAGYNQEQIYSKDTILSQLNQSYHYYTYTTNANINYGLLFGVGSDKSLIFKPQIGLSYYYIYATKINGKVTDPYNSDLAVNSPANGKQNLALNVGLETRKYFKGNSYWYGILGGSKDLWLNNRGDSIIRVQANNPNDQITPTNLDYKNGNQLNMYATLNTGAEMEFLGRFYINAGIGAKVGIVYKDININGNVGMRVVF